MIKFPALDIIIGAHPAGRDLRIPHGRAISCAPFLLMLMNVYFYSKMSDIIVSADTDITTKDCACL